MAESSIVTATINIGPDSDADDVNAQIGFYYYCNGAELVGCYHLIYDSPTMLSFFKQNAYLANSSIFRIKSPSRALNASDGFIVISCINRNSSGSNGINPANQIYPGAAKNSFDFPQFMLLPNDLRCIRQLNLTYDLIDCFFDKMNAPSVENTFLTFQLGYALVKDSDRPIVFDEYNLMPYADSPIDGIQRLSTLSVRESCFTWVTVKDKDNIQSLLDNSAISYGQYVVSFRITIDESKLIKHIDSLGYTEEKPYYIVVYPPSMYLKKHNNIANVLSPKVFGFNPSFSNISFEVPYLFGYDSNLHFKIAFYASESSNTVLYESASYAESNSYESKQWYFTSHGSSSWKVIPPTFPIASNHILPDNGINSKNTYSIKYEMSQNALNALSRISNVVFRIFQYDGTTVIKDVESPLPK